ncbi:asparagine synthase (glutamine-hydrolyzing) [Embleya hyalina]|uniref:asparagine synthase (glutamine-hydrolyzing) n=1 Tax=Embleya hyalina TaxID=516124 RepID=A0A401Z1M2_9ACTN|nr:asparagine synthase (glutamine-hydrolyzing) [Embleya hyalina]GCE00754.1 asparagine synthetase B [Embleya hyalina]
MCGITGWVDHHRPHPTTHPGETTSPDPESRLLLAAMTATMTCRGPDAEGLWHAGPAALGHRRLAILDLAGSAQPMLLGEPGHERLVLTYSGELYNYRELRGELAAAGHHFRTTGDTEVVLAAWHAWGPAAVDRFNGMYAFAVWDTRTRELWLVRDRLGIKPLYYRPLPGGVVFGSEPKAILAHPASRPRVDDEGLAQLMLPLLKVPGRAPWADLREVRPGHLLHVRADGSTTERRYWAPQPREHHHNRAETVAHVRELLADIVTRQLVADVPLCTLLSGGLDSSAITALARPAGGRAPRSFSVGFTDASGEAADTEDDPYVRLAAAHLGSDHRDIVLDGGRLADPEVRAACVRARDLPIGIGDLDLSLHQLFAAIRTHSTVALSGESADEVFGGYRWFHHPEAVHADTFPWMADSPAHGRLHQRILALFRKDVRERFAVEDYVADQYRTALGEVRHHDGAGASEHRMDEIGHLALTRFLPTLLDRKDRLSMAVGLEVRVPFCDHRLVEYVHNIPWSMRTHDGREKSVLRAAVADLLPEAVLYRPKSPYPSTPDPVYSQALRGQLAARLAEPDCRLPELFDDAALHDAVTVSEQGSLIGNVGAELALNFDVWLRAYDPVLPL